MTLQLLDHGLHDERQKRELLGCLRFEVFPHSGTDACDTREINLEEARDMRGDATRLRHVIRGEPTNLRHGLDHITRPDLRRLRFMRDGYRDGRRQACDRCANRRDWRTVEMREDIALRHASRDTGTVDARNLDTVLGGDLPDQR